MGGVVDSVFGGGDSGGGSSSSSTSTTNNTSNVTVNPTTNISIDLQPIQRLAEALSGVSADIVQKNADAQQITQKSNEAVIDKFTSYLSDANKQQFIVALATIGAGLWIKGKIKL